VNEDEIETIARESLLFDEFFVLGPYFDEQTELSNPLNGTIDGKEPGVDDSQNVVDNKID
jgi:hypothetical protein